MRDIVYTLARIPDGIPIGFRGEKNFRRICVDVGAWLAELPAGSVTAAMQRPGDAQAYPVSVTVTENIAVWEANAWAMQTEGEARMQFVITDDDTVVGKSRVFTVKICESLPVGSEPPPDPDPDWFDRIINAVSIAETSAESAEAAADRAEAATVHAPIIGENGNWWIWNQQTEQYEDTGIPVSGGGGSTWNLLPGKPFERIGETLAVNDGTLDVNIHEVDNPAGGRTTVIG